MLPSEREARASKEPGQAATINRWIGTGHLTKDPKFLESESGTAICTLRLAVKRAGDPLLVALPLDRSGSLA